MQIAFIGDIHAFSLRLPPRRLLGRRLLGQSNLWLNRQFHFNHHLLTPLVERIRTLEPDLVLLSGDVTTTSLDDEFAGVVRELAPLTDVAPVVLVPGNHDRYTRGAERQRRIERHLAGLMPARFPHTRSLNRRWRLLALDAARAQLVLSRGKLGREQLHRVSRVLDGLESDDRLLVLCHYPVVVPPQTPSAWSHDLAEAGRLRRLLEMCPAKIVYLHGHIHRPWCWSAEHRGSLAPFTCVNAGSPCLTSRRYPLGQGFWQLTLRDDSTPFELRHHVPRPNTHTRLASRRRRRAQRAVHRWDVRRVL